MARCGNQRTAIEIVLEPLSEHGLGSMAGAMQALRNESIEGEFSQIFALGRPPGIEARWMEVRRRGTFVPKFRYADRA